MVDNQHATEKLFTQSLTARSKGVQDATLKVRVQAAATLAAVTVALSAWVQSDGAERLSALLDRALRALRPSPKTGP